MITGEKKAGHYFTEISGFSLMILWLYTALSKLSDFRKFQHDMYNQEIYPLLAGLLIFLLPTAEITAAILLMFDKTKIFGYYCSLYLLSLFTLYITLVIGNVFKRQPCPCGGILQNVSWGTHLAFNLFFLILIIISLTILKKGETAIRI